MKKIIFAVVFLMTVCTSAYAEQLIWKTEKSLGKAKQLASCDPAKDTACPDTVPYVRTSKFGVKIFETYHEGTRITFSFNGKDEDGFTVATDQVHPGGYDWGGVMVNGKFKPLYMIKRFYEYDTTGVVNTARSELTVLRVLKNGKSCGIDLGKVVVTDNLVARQFAQKNFANPICAQ